MAKGKKGKAKKTPTGSYPVGYGRPPKAHAFKAGQSGNPSGRPKKAPTVVDDLVKEMQRVIAVSVRGKPIKMPKQRALVRRLTDLALQSGRIDAARLVLNLLAGTADEIEKAAPAAPLSEQEMTLFMQFLAEEKADKQ
jgi:hypothetical protein